MKIAVLEDDAHLRQHLGRVLTKQGWAVLEISSIEALNATLETTEEFDLFILDRLIGQRDSTETLGAIRRRHPQARIMIVSSLDLPEERAKWLMAGADEYMGKPVFSEELIARIHLLSKRSQPTLGALLQIRDLSIDKLKHLVLCGSNRVDLTAKEYHVFLLLAENPGRIYNKLQILEHVWGFDSEVETNVVESTINNLRRKLEAAKSKAELKSRRNVGYWIEA